MNVSFFQGDNVLQFLGKMLLILCYFFGHVILGISVHRWLILMQLARTLALPLGIVLIFTLDLVKLLHVLLQFHERHEFVTLGHHERTLLFIYFEC